MKLGENILRLRKETNLSQEKLAEKIGVTRQTISNWELNETRPSPEQLKLLSTLFKISIDQLLDNPVPFHLNKTKQDIDEKNSTITIILKGMGLLFLIIIIIVTSSLILFSITRKDETTNVVKEVSIQCSLKKQDYLITVGSDGHFNCSNCSKDIQRDISSLLDYADIDETSKNIENYFKNKSGECN